MVGRNGAGKSTLLKALVGLVPLQRGQVWVGGREASHMTVAEICRQVAYLAQDPNALLFADTVMEELLITLRNHRISATDAPINPDALLDARVCAAKPMPTLAISAVGAPTGRARRDHGDSAVDDYAGRADPRA